MTLSGYDPLATSNEAFFYDTQEAERIITFAEKYCSHVKGRLARQPLLLEDWQKTYLRNLFGWRHRESGYRRYRQSILELGRKNGKSTIAAVIGLYCLLADQEQGAEIILAATTRDQASILFDICSGMVSQNATLAKKVKVLDSRKRIVYTKTNSFLAAISADAGSHHGLNAHLVIYDELHAAPNRELYDVLTTSQGARTQPLFLCTTTAGYDRNSICFEVHNYGCQVREGIIQDATFLPAIFAGSESDDWKSPDTWKKANPNLGVSIADEYLAKECKKAQDLPAYENPFRQLHLSQWVENKARWIPLDHWRACGVDDFPNLKGQDCFLGMDLSSTRDLSAVAALFPLQDKLYVKCWAFIPEDNARERENTDRVCYRLWAKDENASLIMTPGNCIDFDFIQHKILELAKEYYVQDVSYDRWQATSIVLNLANEGLKLVPVGQGFASLSPLCKEFETRVLNHTIVHDNSPVLNWNIANVSVINDAAGNLKPVKPDFKASQKIDCVVAVLMALSGYMARCRQGDPYSSRGIIVL